MAGDGRPKAADRIRSEPAAPADSSRVIAVPFKGEEYPVLVQGVPLDGEEQGAHTLVLQLHGSRGNARLQCALSGTDRMIPNGSLVATPQGRIPLAGTGHPDGAWAWNVPGVPTTDGQVPTDARDDCRFLLTVIAHLQKTLATDPESTFVMGFSGGARMACVLADRYPDAVRGVAAVAGLRAGTPGPSPVDLSVEDRPVPVLAVHGTADPVNAWDGDDDPRWGPGVLDAARRWATRNRCLRNPRVDRLSEHVVRTAWQPTDTAAAPTWLYTVEGGGHTWPGSPMHVPTVAPEMGAQIDEIDITAEIFAFFAHCRSGPRYWAHTG